MRFILKSVAAAINKATSAGVWVGMLSLMLSLLLITVDTIARYLFHYSTLISDEVSSYLLVAVVFMGLAFTLREQGHVRVDILLSRLSGRPRTVVLLLWSIVAMAVTIFLTQYTIQMALDSLRMKATASSVLRTPIFWPQMVLVIGMVMLILQLIVEIGKAIPPLVKPGTK